jgi:hypothetical protein
MGRQESFSAGGNCIGCDGLAIVSCIEEQISDMPSMRGAINIAEKNRKREALWVLTNLQLAVRECATSQDTGCLVLSVIDKMGERTTSAQDALLKESRNRIRKT